MNQMKLLSIHSRGYRSINGDGVRLAFDEANKNHIVLIGENGSGKSNALKSLYLSERNDDDLPLNQEDCKPCVEIEFSDGSSKFVKKINPLNNHFLIELPEKYEQKLLRSIKDETQRKQLETYLPKLGAYADASTRNPDSLKDISQELSRLLMYSNNIRIVFISNFDVWKSSLNLTAQKIASPDAFTNYIMGNLSDTYQKNLTEYLGGQALTQAKRTNLKTHINAALRKLSEPIIGLELEVDDTLNISTSILEFNTMQKNLAIPITHRSDGEVMLISFLLFLEENKQENSESPTIILFDELERSLDPDNQMLVSELITKVSSNFHFVFTTHSPFMFFKEGIRKNSIIYVTTKIDHATTLKLVEHSEECVLKYPSWAEMNFVAYKIPSLEYHNELYGQVVQDCGSIKNADKKLFSFPKMPKKQYERINSDDQTVPVKCYNFEICEEHNGNELYDKTCVTLPTYIRHLSHHRENQKNKNFTEAELKKSIGLLRKFITTP